MAVQRNIANWFATNNHRHTHPTADFTGVTPTLHARINSGVGIVSGCLVRSDFRAQSIIKRIFTADDFLIIGKATPGDGKLAVFLKQKYAGAVGS